MVDPNRPPVACPALIAVCQPRPSLLLQQLGKHAREWLLTALTEMPHRPFVTRHPFRRSQAEGLLFNPRTPPRRHGTVSLPFFLSQWRSVIMPHRNAHRMIRSVLAAALFVSLLPGLIETVIESTGSASAAPVPKNVLQDTTNSSAVVSAAIRYVQAMAASDRVVVGRLDFACQFRMLAEAGKPLTSFPREADPVYTTCWEPIQRANAEPIERREMGLHAVWPGKDTLVFFGDEVKRPRFAPSSFVSDRLAESPLGGGFRIQHVGTRPLGIASFRIHPEAKLVGAPASLVELRISYQDPLTSPASYAPGTYQWA